MKHKPEEQEIITISRSGDNEVTQIVLTSESPAAMSLFIKRGMENDFTRLALLEMHVKSALQLLRDMPGVKEGEVHDLLIASIEAEKAGEDFTGGKLNFIY